LEFRPDFVLFTFHFSLFTFHFSLQVAASFDNLLASAAQPMVRFGPFALDTRTWTLSRDGAAVDLSPRLVEILAYLVQRDGAIATKEELLDRFWPDVHVTENTLARAIADIRKALGDPADQPRVIQTLARRGYRFMGDARVPEPAADPFRQWVAGRLALESLDHSRLAEARNAMHAAALAMPDYAPAQAGVANACVVSFEATRSGNRPDDGILQAALAAAQRAAELDPQLGEAWAVMAHAQALAGRRDEAQAAARRAVALEPGNWRHHFRLALASWGEERLRAADRARALSPSCASAHLLSAMVFVARGAWDRAEAAAEAGARLQDAQTAGAVLPASGLHWMRGLVGTAQGRVTEALAAFDAEMAGADAGVFAREFHWLAATSRGFLQLRHGRRVEATAAFARAEALNPGAARGVVGRHVAGGLDRTAAERAIAELADGPKASDAALLRAALFAWTGDTNHACDVLRDLLERISAGPTGWNLAADPMFLPLGGVDRLRPLLIAVASRAA
jgi:DNA-binding winged helix-turn-helix (wHTH) protein